MKTMGWVLGAALLVACGGRAATPGTDESNVAGGAGMTDTAAGASGASTSNAGAPGVGPIDATGLPDEFPTSQCDGPLGSLHLALPCKVGMPLGSANGFSEVECNDVDGRTAVTFGLFLPQAATLIGKPIALSMGELLQISYAKLEVGGVDYLGTLAGSLTFTQVDPTARAFVSQLTDGSITWKADDGTETRCALPPTPLWATAGDFQ